MQGSGLTDSTDCTSRIALPAPEPASAIPSNDFQLVISAGPCVGQTYVVSPGIVLGRTSESNITLADTTVSRRHARFDLAGGRCFVTDLGSRNGTFVNDRRVLSRTEIDDGDRLRLGSAILTLRRGEDVQLLSRQVRDTRDKLAHALAELDATRALLLQKEKLAAIGQLAAGIAHEINNPLTFILANLTTLKEYVAEPACAGEPNEFQQIVSDAHQGAHRVAAIVRDLRSFSRADDGNRAALDVGDVLEFSIAIAWPEIKPRATIVREYGSVPLVIASERHLGQVFVNLLVNAAQAIPEGSPQSNVVVVSTRRENDSVVVGIMDNGSGIAAPALDHIFEPFFTTKPAGKGTGLGLFICQNILTMFGGTLRVKSEVGKGSLFEVVLPAAANVVAVPESEEPITELIRINPKRARVLIIDDEPLVGATLKRALAMHEVRICTSGQQACSLVKDGERYDVVLCDINMPGMNGIRFLEILGHLAPDQVNRLLFMTGDLAEPEVRNFVDGIAHHCIEKPFEVARIRAAVDSILYMESMGQ